MSRAPVHGWGARSPNSFRWFVPVSAIVILAAIAARTGEQLNCANALSDLERYEEARVRYERALQLDPDFAAAQYNVGVLLLNQNQAASAIAHLEEALRLKPQFLGRAEARGR